MNSARNKAVKWQTKNVGGGDGACGNKYGSIQAMNWNTMRHETREVPVIWKVHHHMVRATEMGREVEPEDELTLRLARPGRFGLTPEAHSPASPLILNICE